MTQLRNQYDELPVGRTPEVRDEGVVSRLRDFIADGGYVPGDRLPAERDLIGELGLTRSALRKALETLERDGTIWRHVGKGTFVSSAEPTGGGGFIVELGRQLTPYRMMRARICIEPAIAREAAINASGEAMTRMRSAVENASTASTWAEYEEQDDRLHRCIAEASDNALLLALFDQLKQVHRAVAWGAVSRETVRPRADHSSFAEHRAIAEAIAKRDPEAACEAMRVHLRSVSARLFEGEH